MQKADLLDSFEYAGKTIKVEWFDVDAIEKLPKVKWHQVYAICNLEGRVPVVLYQDAHVNLPGGRTEPGESIEETLRRELAEEINCEVLGWHPIGYQKLNEPGVIDPIYQLRVYAEVKKAGEFERDSGGEVIGYKVIELQDLNKEIAYGSVGERMVRLVGTNFSSTAA